jgi:hypothetical protein
MDPELAWALKMSMMEQKKEEIKVIDEPSNDADPATVVVINLRMPDGSK